MIPFGVTLLFIASFAGGWSLDRVAEAPTSTPSIAVASQLAGGQHNADRVVIQLSNQARELPAQISGEVSTRWKLTGDKALRPTAITDDGRKTYITWEGERAMPAVFAVGTGGKEEMVEGYVRAGAFTIDRVYDVLIFRIDRRSASARRLVERGPNHE